jgi:hypothetical protein
MAAPPGGWPVIINSVAEDVVKAARSNAVHGKLRISQDPKTKDYVIALVIPAGETVMSRARGV